MRAIILLLVLIAGSAGAQVSPFNGRAISDQARDGNYRLILSGHFHGSSSDRSGFPAGTLLASLDLIDSLNADIFLSTGDLFLDPKADHQRYQRSLFDKLNVPLFNAPGNHDKSDHYSREFGPTYGMIELGNDRIVLIDTEVNDGTLKEDQLDMFRDLLEQPVLDRIFIISHRPLWAEEDDRYAPLFEGNTRSMLGNNYTEDVLPLIEKLSLGSQIFWVSGSMAGYARSSIFFQEHAKNITYIQAAIRNEPRDAILVADVGPDEINWRTISLTGAPVLAPQHYDAEWWWSQKDKKEGFNWRLLPYMIRSTVTHAG
ncbi:MAG: metallophosphoesterase, partial [Bacteroidota bacterium]|nr:metallophosphoesterase [Bacteroidota bacterium]